MLLSQVSVWSSFYNKHIFASVTMTWYLLWPPPNHTQLSWMLIDRHGNAVKSINSEPRSNKYSSEHTLYKNCTQREVDSLKCFYNLKKAKTHNSKCPTDHKNVSPNPPNTPIKMREMQQNKRVKHPPQRARWTDVGDERFKHILENWNRGRTEEADSSFLLYLVTTN